MTTVDDLAINAHATYPFAITLMEGNMVRPAKQAGTVEIDPAFAPVIAAFAGDEEVLLGRIFVSTGLQTNGKFFAFARRGQMVVKLPRERVRELIESGAGEPFDRGRGKPLPEWAVIPPGRADWIAIAQEARRFVGGGK